MSIEGEERVRLDKSGNLSQPGLLGRRTVSSLASFSSIPLLGDVVDVPASQESTTQLSTIPSTQMGRAGMISDGLSSQETERAQSETPPTRPASPTSPSMRDTTPFYDTKELWNDRKISVFASESWGRKDCMEDIWCIRQRLNRTPYLFCGVFDGHLGHTASEIASRRIPDIITDNLTSMDIRAAVENSFTVCDREIKHSLISSREGTTATIALISTDDSVIVANCGDSRGILVSKNTGKDGGWKAEQLTIDHNCDNPDEVKRIREHKGHVFHERVEGQLELTRRLGGTEFCASGVVCDPYLCCFNIKRGIDCAIVLATDGVWKVLDNETVAQHVGSFIEEKVDKEKQLRKFQECADSLVDKALKHGSLDNVTVVLVVIG